MLAEIKKINFGKKELRNFGILIGVILLGVSTYYYFRNEDTFKLFLVLGIILWVVSLTVPSMLKMFYHPWMIFATVLGWVMTRVILSILFYTVLTPIGVLARVFGKSFIELKWDNSQKTYWNDKKDVRLKNGYEKQF